MIICFHTPLHNPSGFFRWLRGHMHAGVDLFVFLAGFGLAWSLRQQPDCLSYYRRRLRRLLPAYYVMVLPLMVLAVASALRHGADNPWFWPMRHALPVTL